MVVPPEGQLKKQIAYYFHDRPFTGHAGRDGLTQKIMACFWWPGINEWIKNYVKGCMVCQQNKNLTHQQRTPQFCIPAHLKALPFKVIAMNLITQLPNSEGSDAILTIVDQGCTQAAVFLPCSTSVTGEEVTQLYMENVY